MSAQAEAYARGWSLLGDLLLNGLNEHNIATVEEVPELAPFVTLPFDAEREAVQHYDLFGFNIFPYASTFLAQDGLLEGEISRQIHTLYLQHDFAAYNADVAADHLGLMARFLAQLAWESAATQGEEHWIALQSDVVATWLLPWLPAFSHGVQRQSAPFYEAVVALVLALALSTVPHDMTIPAPRLPATTDPLASERSGLREIAAFLVQPAQSGLFLSRADIGRLAHDFDLPRGFGSRADLLENTMRSAAQYNAFPALVTALRGLLQSESKAHAALRDEQALLTAVAAAWQARLAHAETVLTRIADAATMP